MVLTMSLKAENPVVNFHEWWTSNDLHLLISLEGEMPRPDQNQAAYFLNFKNTWVVEAEGIINSRLKHHALQVGSLTAGESNDGTDHHLTLHIILKQVKKENRHKQCNIMAFIYTSNSDKKNLKQTCVEKIEKELVNFKKEWKVEHFFFGYVENGNNTQMHRTRWHGVIGVK